MKKSEIVYRYILEKAIYDKTATFVERSIANELGISPNTVSIALAPLSRSGAVKIHARHFDVLNIGKMLIFWAVNRRPDKDVIYKTYVQMRNPDVIERQMPDEIAYTVYSGYVNIFGNDASDYSEVYVYATAESLEEIKARFPKNKLSQVRSRYYNLFVLKPDNVLERQINGHMLKYSSVSVPQLFADMWNVNQWYSYDFMKKLREKINGIYGKTILE